MLLYANQNLICANAYQVADIIFCRQHYQLGLPIVTAMDVVAQHANLPEYGLEWHKAPMALWDEWLQPYLGAQLSVRVV